MKNHHRKLIVSGFAIAFVAAATAAGALAQSHPRRQMSPADRMDRLAEKLNLTGDQRAAVEKTLTAHEADMKQRFEDLKIAQDDLHARIHADTFDENAIRSAAGSVASVEEEMAVERGRLLKEMRGILTADQYAQFEKMGPPREGRRAFRGGGMGPGPGPHAHRGWSDDTE